MYTDKGFNEKSDFLVNARLRAKGLEVHSDLLVKVDGNSYQGHFFYVPILFTGNSLVTKDQKIRVMFVGYILAEIQKTETFLLDVRTKGEYDDGHIKNATLIPVNVLEKRISELDSVKNNTVLIYCRSGNRSTVGSDILIKNGFKRVLNLDKGIKGWKKSGFSVE